MKRPSIRRLLRALISVGEPRPPVSPEDIVGVYRLVLAREPDIDPRALAADARSLDEEIAHALASAEFQIAVADRARKRRPILRQGYEAGPGTAPVEWGVARLQLSDKGRAAVRGQAGSWAGFYDALFNDAVFAAAIGPSPALDSEVLEGLRLLAAAPARFTVEGEIEERSGLTVRGWALDVADPDRPIGLELYADGTRLHATPTWAFRRDLQARFGGTGRIGFTLALPETLRRREAVDLELRAENGAVIGIIALASASPPLDDIANLGWQLAQVRASLERVEDALKLAAQRLTFPPEDYSAYAAAYYPDPAASPLAAGRAPETMKDAAAETVAIVSRAFRVIMNAFGTPPAVFEAAVWAVAGQTYPHWALTLVCGEGESLRVRDLKSRLSWTGRSIEVQTCATATDAARLAAAATAVTEPYILLTTGWTLLATDALVRFCERLRAGAAAVYADEDRFAPKPANGMNRFDPGFKTVFDLDHLLQTPYVGGTLAVSRAAFMENEVGDPCAGAFLPSDLALRIGAGGGEVAHLARVLSSVHHHAPRTQGDWASCVTRYLSTAEPDAVIEPHTDLMGRGLPGALRIRRPGLRGKGSARVIVPTRDRLDLLKPCIDSVLAHVADNAVRMTLVVVDNGSVEAETLAWLKDFASKPDCELLSAPGAFNWALLNNLAAAEGEEDMLVFLNNDTIVKSVDWLDELCEQAMRSEVGAAGARLVYGDDTLQHAGVVLRGEESFVAHEGVGEAGSSPGYQGRHLLLRRVLATTGACMATRREIFRSLGGFDAAALPVEGNDVDYCLRLTAAGLKVLYDPYAVLYHLESKSRGFNDSPEKRAQSAQALDLLWTRWGSRFGEDPFYNAHFDRAARPFTRLRPPPL